MTQEAADIAHVNDVPLLRAGEQVDDATLRQRACTELLRQQAQAAGLLAPDDPPPKRRERPCSMSPKSSRDWPPALRGVYSSSSRKRPLER